LAKKTSDEKAKKEAAKAKAKVKILKKKL